MEKEVKGDRIDYFLLTTLDAYPCKVDRSSNFDKSIILSFTLLL